MRSDFETWINGLTDDDGSGTVGDIPNKAFFNTQMGLIDDAINTTGGLITSDTTYYVATTGSDTTGDGSVTTPWATPAKALAVLGNYRVQEGKTVTIQCDDGIYTFTSPITNLPKGFLLTGKKTYTKTMSSVQSSSGSPGLWSVVVNLDNVANITTSDYAIFSGASGGTNPKYIEGVWDITAVDAVNNRITVATTHLGASAPASTVAATVTILKTVFSFSGVSGIFLQGVLAGTIKNCLILGDNTASTHGIALTASSISAQTVGISNFGVNGIISSSGSTFNGIDMIAIAKSGSSAIYANKISEISIFNGVVSGNSYIGLSSVHGGCIYFSGTVSGNANYGVSVSRHAECRVANATLNANTTYDIYVERYGYVYAVGATIAGSTSPAVNTQGNEYGYIDT